MREVLLINPLKRGTKTRRRRKASAKKGAIHMAKRRRRRSTVHRRAAAPVARTTTRRRRRRSYKHNPSAPPSRARRYARAASGRLFGGLNLKTALHEGLPVLAGLFAAKLGARKFGGGTETDPASWTMKTYLYAGLTGGGAAILANMLRPGWGQKVFTGAIAFLGFKLLENEFIANNQTASGWLGAANLPLLDLDGAGTPWMMSADGSALPLDERHRMALEGYGAEDLPELQGYEGADEAWGDDASWGEALTTPGRLGLGEAMIPAGRLGRYHGEGDEIRAAQINKYRAANQF